jgi:hypothetical protein
MVGSSSSSQTSLDRVDFAWFSDREFRVALNGRVRKLWYAIEVAFA